MANEETAAAQEQEQWRGAVEARLPSTPAAAAWPHVADFFALHRYLPGIDVCERVESDGDGNKDDDDGGDKVRPGCVRYCAAYAPGTEEVATWAREELVELDAERRRLAYAIVANNMGFGRYVASMTVLPGAGEDEPEEAAAGCRLVWAFECEPMQGWSCDKLVEYLDAGLKVMAARIEEAAAVATGAIAAGAVAA